MSEESLQRPAQGDIDKAMSEATGLREEKARLEKKARRLARLVVVLALALLASVVYGRDGYSNPDLGVTDEMVTRWGQAAIYDLVVDMEGFRSDNGRLPRDLSELGLGAPFNEGGEYTPDGSEGYSVSLQTLNGAVSYSSGEDLSPFEAAAGSRAITPAGLTASDSAAEAASPS